ncbi:MAG: competence/damage-inducible protein A [Clostridiales bacterium]|jgi:nicotinamide-nucleotide amidase|nr:competence/damage-inducible protein A [Clostridiales bacterium]
MNAEIIGVGTELLLGQIVNTDAQYLSQKLSQLGINLFYHTVVGDNMERVKQALSIAVDRVDLIITTGGLGPTMDDLTKEAIAEFLGLKLVAHQPSIDAMEAFFVKRGRTISKNNYKQADFPEGAIILPNSVGTAPGAIVEYNDKIFVILPGPPRELQPMFENHVIPYLESKSDEKIVSKVLKIYGIGESVMEEKIQDILANQSNPTIAPLAGDSELTLRITAKTARNDDPLTLIQPLENRIRERLGDLIYGVDGDTLESVVVNLLTRSSKTLAVAESCTGGLIAQRITSIPGASNVFIEGTITYSNQSKIERLGVTKKTLNDYGAVSYETATEMVKGILHTTGADVGISITGIAGPRGGTPDKPVGLVYIAIADKNGYMKVQEHNLLGERTRVQQTAASIALDSVRRMLLNIN